MKRTKRGRGWPQVFVSKNYERTCPKSVINHRPRFVLLEQVHGHVLPDGDVDELLGRVNGIDDGRQVVNPAAGAKGFG